MFSIYQYVGKRIISIKTKNDEYNKSRRNTVSVIVNKKKVSINRICINCGCLIELNKGLCGKCYMEKLKGQL